MTDRARTEIPVDWGGDERRRTSPMTLADLERHIDARIQFHLDAHSKAELARIDARFDELKTLLASAFPGGDPSEHRRYHQEVMDFMNERRLLWRAIREKTLTALLWGVLVTAGSAAWHYLKAKIGSP